MFYIKVHIDLIEPAWWQKQEFQNLMTLSFLTKNHEAKLTLGTRIISAELLKVQRKRTSGGFASTSHSTFTSSRLDTP
jgi:hypothetical protein